MAMFSAASKPIAWQNESKLEGPSWPTLGQVFGKEWSTQREWTEQIWPSTESQTRDKWSKNLIWYGQELREFMMGIKPLAWPQCKGISRLTER
jgi:hypothetical protein